ncbi:MAG: RNA polymerase sigma factor [Gammaproteobacteria bacterium]|nr:RNA polymerase sigma factor [Gammaproteobacteria bacterium]
MTASDADSSATHRLERFLAAVERRALVTAELATRDRDEALDIVQDSMLAFARRYATKPPPQWPPLFHRVLQNRIRDWHRRRNVRQRLFGWWPRGAPDDTDDGGDAWQRVADPAAHSPETLVAADHAGDAMIDAIAKLPTRQREAFLLRVWQGLDVAGTAAAMGCSAGSVKTHLSRALATLRAHLQDHRQ